MYDIVTLGRLDKALEPRNNIATSMSSVLDLLTPNSIGSIFVPWVDHTHDMVTLGSKANSLKSGNILSTDRWTDNPTPPPTNGGKIVIKGSLLIPNIHLVSN